MLRFVEKEKFVDRTAKYEKQLIKETFTKLCKKVSVYNEASKTFDLGKSDIFQKIF